MLIMSSAFCLGSLFFILFLRLHKVLVFGSLLTMRSHISNPKIENILPVLNSEKELIEIPVIDNLNFN
jgi:hypothetical protein